MGNEISREEKIALLIGCGFCFLLIYFSIKHSGIEPIWPVTWLVVILDVFFLALLYIGLPASVVYGLYWLLKELLELRLILLRSEIRDGNNYLKNQLSEIKKHLTKENYVNVEEIKKIKKELQAMKKELEARNAPVQEVQEQTLQNFIS